MREIKFRAWDKERKIMRGVDQLNFDDSESYGLLLVSERSADKYDLMQFTGLFDRDGVPIYEKDILCFDQNMTADDSMGAEPNGFIYDESDKYLVIWDKEIAAWGLDFADVVVTQALNKFKRDTRWLMIDGSCKIAGNIHQNPEPPEDE